MLPGFLYSYFPEEKNSIKRCAFFDQKFIQQSLAKPAALLRDNVLPRGGEQPGGFCVVGFKEVYEY